MSDEGGLKNNLWVMSDGVSMAFGLWIIEPANWTDLNKGPPPTEFVSNPRLSAKKLNPYGSMPLRLHWY